MPCPPVLQQAIESLYQTFFGYPLPEDTHPCSCCHTPKADELLHSAPLRELTWRHLAVYANDAILTWGDLDCLKHFPPRIIEVAVRVQSAQACPPMHLRCSGSSIEVNGGTGLNMSRHR
jgi:hypothetical protein